MSLASIEISPLLPLNRSGRAFDIFEDLMGGIFLFVLVVLNDHLFVCVGFAPIVDL